MKFFRKKHMTAGIFISALLLVCVLVLFSCAMKNITAVNTEEQQTIIENAVNRSISQCYALEGFYPSDLKYLEEHYGLTYSQENFMVDYQYIGSNLRPDVTVIKRLKS